MTGLLETMLSKFSDWLECLFLVIQQEETLESFGSLLFSVCAFVVKNGENMGNSNFSSLYFVFQSATTWHKELVTWPRPWLNGRSNPPALWGGTHYARTKIKTFLLSTCVGPSVEAWYRIFFTHFVRQWRMKSTPIIKNCNKSLGLWYHLLVF